MVIAILNGQKTVTRRLIKPQPTCEQPHSLKGSTMWWGYKQFLPFCSVGDILWVRETWAEDTDLPYDNYIYRADDENPIGWVKGYSWHPSIHMPKDAARIFLRVTGVRVERLEEITEKEVWREGIESECRSCEYYLASECRDCANRFESFDMFSSLWDSTIKPDDISRYGWNANPYVWVIEFERCEKPEGWPV